MLLDIEEEIKDNADLEFSSSEEPETRILVLAKAAFNFKLPVIWLEDLPPEIKCNFNLWMKLLSLNKIKMIRERKERRVSCLLFDVGTCV